MQSFNFIIFYRNKTKIDPTAATTNKRMFTDLRYLFVSGLTFPFEKAPAPKDITK